MAVDTDTGEVVKLSVPTKAGMTVKLAGSAELVLVDRSRNFDDTRNHWAKDAINFATAHELFSGTSDTAFTPDNPMTRAMLMTVLARFDGQDTTGGAVWYEKAMEWARENGISDGSDPDGSITRERNDIKVGKVNVDEQPELASRFGVVSIPTLVVMKNGKIVDQAIGARPKNAILGML